MTAALVVSTVVWLVVVALLLQRIQRERAERKRREQRGGWPIRTVGLDEFSPVFRPGPLGPTLATEVAFIGHGPIPVPGGTSDAESWVLAVLAREARLLFEAPFTPLCIPAIGERLQAPGDLARETLLRSYRNDWPEWFAAAGARLPAIHGPMFDSSSVMIEAALLGAGVALAPVAMFERELREGRLVRPFDAEVVTGSYWLTRLKSKEPGPAMRAFEGWIFEQAS